VRADGIATLHFHPEALPSWLGPGYKERTELCLTHCCCTGSTSKLSTWPHLPYGTLVLWLHDQDALELPPCPVSDQYLSKGSGVWISQQKQRSKTSQTGCLWHGLMNRHLVILALSAV